MIYCGWGIKHSHICTCFCCQCYRFFCSRFCRERDMINIKEALSGKYILHDQALRKWGSGDGNTPISWQCYPTKRRGRQWHGRRKIPRHAANWINGRLWRHYLTKEASERQRRMGSPATRHVPQGHGRKDKRTAAAVPVWAVAMWIQQSIPP